MIGDDERYDNISNDLVHDPAGLGFCGCGDPVLVVRTIVDALKCYDPEDGCNADELRALFQDDRLYLMVMYTLDRLDWVEHGTSLPGWITEKGQKAREDLEYWLSVEESGRQETS